MEAERNGYVISTDKARLDRTLVYEWLSQRSYWAQGRNRETQERAIDNSLCFGVYAGARQVGFARVVTDYATFGWLCDVFVDENERGHGLGKWLIATIVAHPELAKLRRLTLATRDAHELYRSYGHFAGLAHPERWMMRVVE